MTSSIDGRSLTSSGLAAQATNNASLFSQGGPSFKDVLDSVNPLQQLPGVGAVYRSTTGDTVSPIAKIAGGALFGGPIGAIIGAVDAVVQMATGSDTSSHVMAALDSSPPVPPVDQVTATAMAAASNPAPVVAAATSDATASTIQGISLAAARNPNEALVYGRQQALYAQGQGMEALYGQAVKQIHM